MKSWADFGYIQQFREWYPWERSYSPSCQPSSHLQKRAERRHAFTGGAGWTELTDIMLSALSCIDLCPLSPLSPCLLHRPVWYFNMHGKDYLLFVGNSYLASTLLSSWHRDPILHVRSSLCASLVLGMYKLFVPVGGGDKVTGGLRVKGKHVDVIQLGMPGTGLSGWWGGQGAGRGARDKTSGK